MSHDFNPPNITGDPPFWAKVAIALVVVIPLLLMLAIVLGFLSLAALWVWHHVLEGFQCTGSC